MKKIYPKLFAALFCVLLVGMWGCSDFNDNYEMEKHEMEEPTPSFSLDNVIYHEGTKSYMVPQKDPYTLVNFQNAYEKLATGNSDQVLTRSQMDEFSETTQLEATHYALKVFPKNEAEQWEIELMEDIKVTYIPFDQVQLPEDMEEKVMAISTRSQIPTYPELSPYEVVYDDFETLEDMPKEIETCIMPILYVVWPCDKPLPEGIDYVIAYEVFLPQHDEERTRSSAGLSTEALQMLENEAISLALGISAQTRVQTRSSIVRTLTGRIYQYDNLLRADAPMQNLKVQFKLGSNIWETYTQSNGYFSITNLIPLEASFGYTFHHPRWKITFENNTAPITTTWGTVEDWWRNTSEVYLEPGSSHPTYEIHRAVNYFYNGSHSVGKWYYNEGIRIRAISRTDASANAYFSYSKKNQAYITVYYNNNGNESRIIGTVLHELGHFVHFGERGGYTGSAYNGFIGVHSLIKESYASYVGWYLGERYYSTLGWVKSSVTQDITGQARQSWWKTDGSTAYYSPLFVDLVDDFNQGTYWSSSYNSDQIKNFPHSIIRTMSAECTTWSDVKTKLQQYVGVYYTTAEYNSFVAPYDYWF